MNAPIRPRSARRLTDDVFRILHSRIISGELVPGSRVDVEAIATELDISRTPVREAILQLEASGLIERQAYRGSVVSGVDAARLEEVMALRIEMEGLAAELGAPRLSDEDLARMDAVLVRAEQESGSPDFALGRFNELNREFHRLIYVATDSATLLRIIDILSSEADRIRLHFNVRNELADSYHHRILDACVQRDSAAARDLTREHLLEAYFSMHGKREVVPGILQRVLDETDMRIPALEERQ